MISLVAYSTMLNSMIVMVALTRGTIGYNYNERLDSSYLEGSLVSLDTRELENWTHTIH